MNDPNHQPPTPGSIAVIMPAAGRGQRFGEDRNKLFTTLAGKPLWFRSAQRLASQSLVGRIIMPIAAADRDAFTTEFSALIAELSIELVDGGAQRTDSVRAGLSAIAGQTEIRWVAVHDAARPLVSDSDLTAVFGMATQTGAAILATPVSGTIKRRIDHSSEKTRTETVDRRDLWIAQTPQVFAAGLLIEAYKKHNGRPATDDAELVERIGYPVTIVPGSSANLKITYPEDLAIAEAIWGRQNENPDA